MERLNELKAKLDKQIKQSELFIDNAKALKLIADSALREMTDIRLNLIAIQNEIEDISAPKKEEQTTKTKIRVPPIICKKCECCFFVQEILAPDELPGPYIPGKPYFCSRCHTISKEYTEYMIFAEEQKAKGIIVNYFYDRPPKKESDESNTKSEVICNNNTVQPPEIMRYMQEKPLPPENNKWDDDLPF